MPRRQHYAWFETVSIFVLWVPPIRASLYHYLVYFFGDNCCESEMAHASCKRMAAVVIKA